MVVSPLMYTAGTIVGGISLGVIGATIWSITKRKIKPKNVAVLAGLFVSALWIVVSIARAHDHLAGHLMELHLDNASAHEEVEVHHAEVEFKRNFPDIPAGDIEPPPPPPRPPPPPPAAITRQLDKRWPRKHEPDLTDWNDDNLHIIFSTGCSPYQQWQSELLFYTHKKIGQKGRLTRLVSGCENHDTVYWSGINSDTVTSEVLHRSTVTDPRYSVHVTPHFEGSNKCPFVNKPYSVNHWAHHGDHGDLTKQVVVVIDPDEMMLRPLELLNRDLFYKETLFDSKDSKVSPVQPGRPVAQYYQIGSSWVKTHDNKDYVKKRGFNSLTESQCGVGAKCTKVSEKEVWDHFSPGPPYFIHGRDIQDFSATWANYTPALADVSSNSLYTEMWSYAMAASEHELPHTHLMHFMISHAFSRDQEAWIGWADEQEKGGMSCRAPKAGPGVKYPPFLHFCQNIKVNDAGGVQWMWHKGHVPKNIFDCDLPIIKPPPDNLYNIQKDQPGHRNAWILCHLIAHLNEMLVEYKGKFCPNNTGNTSKMIRLYQGENKPDRREKGGCKQKDRKLCFPLATLEQEWPEGQ